jgi:hypothetical protein
MKNKFIYYVFANIWLYQFGQIISNSQNPGRYWGDTLNTVILFFWLTLIYVFISFFLTSVISNILIVRKMELFYQTFLSKYLGIMILIVSFLLGLVNFGSYIHYIYYLV